MSNNHFRAVDFFCGAGGLTHGLLSAGISVLAGIDNDASCKETFEKNNKGAVFLAKDIEKYIPEKLMHDLHIKRKDDYMIFTGCAPCQFWSIMRTHRKKSEQTKNLILDFQKFVEYFLPGFVLIENVPGISSKKDSPLGNFLAALTKLGYSIAHDVTDMSLYGVPQKRRRFTLLASRVINISLPKKTGETLTVRHVLGIKNGFPRINAGAKDNTKFMHTAAGLNQKNLDRLHMTPHDGGDRSSWQHRKDYQLACYASGEKKFYDTYSRMWWDRPSPTITTKFFNISNGRFAHPNENRALSLREGATLQTFPKDYEFIGKSITSIAKMIGNAVPPKFAAILGKHIVASTKKQLS